MTRAEVRAIARLGRRTARREWRRTTLVAVLVAVPVMVGIGVAGVMRAADVTPEERATQAFGQAALRVHYWPGEAPGSSQGDGGPPEPAWPEGATVMDTIIREAAGDAPVVTYREYWGSDGEVTDLDVTSSLAEGRLALVAGRTPEADDEVVASRRFLDEHDAAVGDTLGLFGGVDVTVVGVLRDPTDVHRSLAAVEPALLDRLAASEGDGWASWETASPRWLVGEGVDADVFRAAVEQGLEAAIPADVPAAPIGDESIGDERVDAARPVGSGSPPHVQVDGREEYLAAQEAPAGSRPGQLLTPQVIATLVTSILLAEVALIAGAAYATGARRRLRELGLLGANGATTTHVRAAVVGEATVTGIMGGIVGVLGGIGALAFGRPLVQRFVGPLITHLELSVTDLVGPALAAVLAVSVAAWLPARTAAHVPTTTALQGRMPLSDPKRWLTPAGIVLAGFGALLLLVGMLASGTVGGLVAAIGVLLAIGGTAMLTVPLVALLGRFADRVPAMLRLVVRDSGRQRTRAAAASASAMVVLIAPVLVATISLSDEHHQLVNGLPDPDDHVFVPPNERMLGGDGPVAASSDADAGIDRSGSLQAIRAEVPDAAHAEATILDQRATLTPDPQFEPPPIPPTVPVDELRSDAEAFWWAGPGGGAHVGLATQNLVGALGDTGVADAIADEQAVVLGITNRATTVTIGGQHVSAVEVPVAVLDGFPRVLLPAAIADALGLQPVGTGDLYVAPTAIGSDTASTLYRTVNGVDVRVGSAGFGNGPVLRWLAVGITLAVALLILALVTMLSATESDHDLRTMVAVGGAPRMRRRFLGLQGTVHAFVGAVLAVPLALALAWAALSSQGYDRQGVFGFVSTGSMWVDWPTLAAVLLGVPVVIGVAIALLVRSAPTVPPRRVG